MTARLRPSPAPVAADPEPVTHNPAPVTVSTLHLSEDRQRWTLTLSLTPELLALIDDAAQGDEPVRTTNTTPCRMQVEPNLLPGGPFSIDEIVVTRAPQPTPSQSPSHSQPPQWKRVIVILLGVILLIVGFLTHLAFLWTIGIVLIVVGVILAILGAVGREVGGRKHWY